MDSSVYIFLDIDYNHTQVVKVLEGSNEMDYSDIRFPHLGIVLKSVGRYIQIGNFQIMYYGIIIACAFLIGLLFAQHEAKRTGQDPDIYIDYLLCMVIPAIIGARAYYVIFAWDMYKNDPIQILNIRNGGLGIVGGVIAAFIVLVIFTRVRKQSLLLMLDTVAMPLLLGQIMGRWGNFFNREAFGGYTNGPLAMQIPLGYFIKTGRVQELAGTGILEHLVYVNVSGQQIPYIQVHPTFLYEGLWNLALLLIIFFYRKHKKFDGELICLYFCGYGVGRFLIEGLRIDQLKIGHTGIAVTQVVCVVIFLIGLIGMITQRAKARRSSDKNIETKL